MISSYKNKGNNQKEQEEHNLLNEIANNSLNKIS